MALALIIRLPVVAGAISNLGNEEAGDEYACFRTKARKYRRKTLRTNQAPPVQNIGAPSSTKLRK